MDDAIAILVNAGLVAGLVEAVKRAAGDRFPWSRFGALVALTLGVLTAEAGVALGWYASDVEPGGAVLVGLIAGLTASGLYKAQQAVRES